ncbi:hypothetical protein HYPSUDRAFT_209466 [Hypholoma sublateritium FD-334 SS-4]|uniref:Uncharacterized protein n=1 Tax=Hypholoma sublateritium (strain FD-334 SS-4) TaxID=945553 RepID=A0A0D2LRR0_HYPSF|nr:hypothetical protein HYPSUDRAFT_209466 [Hypholoma sublateritium FD-334 SS-4]
MKSLSQEQARGEEEDVTRLRGAIGGGYGCRGAGGGLGIALLIALLPVPIPNLALVCICIAQQPPRAHPAQRGLRASLTATRAGTRSPATRQPRLDMLGRVAALRAGYPHRASAASVVRAGGT